MKGTICSTVAFEADHQQIAEIRRLAGRPQSRQQAQPLNGTASPCFFRSDVYDYRLQRTLAEAGIRVRKQLG